MPHIHTEPNQHDLTVSAYIVRLDTAEPRILLHMHRKHNILLPVGGHVELDENIQQALAHEILEESGYSIEQVKFLQPKSRIRRLSGVEQHPYPVSINTHRINNEHLHTDLQYALVVDSEPRHSVAEGESTDLRWLSKSEINNLQQETILDVNKEICNFIFDEALTQWEVVDVEKEGIQ